MEPALPPFALFPESASWRQQISAADWTAYLESWLSLAGAHLALPDPKFAAALSRDESPSQFLSSLARAVALAGPAVLGDSPAAASLKRAAFLLTARAFRTPKPPVDLLQWEFLSDFTRVHGKRQAGLVLAALAPSAVGLAEASLSGLKKFLVKNMDAGLAGGGDLRGVEERLQRVNYLVSAWPAAGALFLAGSDYLDALISCFTIMNPPLRKCIITNAYLGLIGLTEGSTPRYSLLSDLLYSLRGAAEEHKKGPLNVNDSLVAELVTVTPILQQIRQRAEASSASTSRLLNILKDLALFRKAGSGLSLPHGRLKRKAEKGKAVAAAPTGAEEELHLHAHKLSQISQIQDLFPDLGSAFVAKLLAEYSDDSEQVVAHLLEDSLPKHLDSADRAENLSGGAPLDTQHSELAPHATPPLLPSRRNIFDGDELDSLALETSRLHFGKHEAATTADDVLRDRSTAPNKAAILSALATFDSDDDERDDTYDAADVGGTVDNTATGGAGDDLHEANEHALFAAYQASPKIFDRDAATRRSDARARLREETSMTNEAIEGWGLMLSRNPQQRRRLEVRFSAFSGAQAELLRTSWRASDQPEGDDSETDGGAPSRGGRGGGGGYSGRGGRGGRGGSRGNVAGPTGEKETGQARQRKEAHKGSRANHNRRDQRAKKMARGGFPG